jgi:hypothetical protein
MSRRPRTSLTEYLLMKQRILGSLTEEQRAEWESAVAQAEADGTFFIATPHHCAVGVKPVTIA